MDGQPATPELVDTSLAASLSYLQGYFTKGHSHVSARYFGGAIAAPRQLTPEFCGSQLVCWAQVQSGRLQGAAGRGTSTPATRTDCDVPGGAEELRYIQECSWRRCWLRLPPSSRQFLIWSLTSRKTWMGKRRTVRCCTPRTWALSRSRTWSSIRLWVGDTAPQK